jgi:alkylation response protein AidB-like acyl-CoA dehydrogenase
MSAAEATPDGDAAVGGDPVERARGLARLIGVHSDAAESARRLSQPVVEALTSAGLMRLCVPAAYGGPEVDPMTLVAVIEELSRADGAAGWCAMIASTTSSMAAFLPVETAAEVYGPADTVTGGVFAPNGRGTAAVRDGVDGFEVSGRWSWGSGTQHCRWVLGGTRCDDGTFRLCWAPVEQVEFHDTWHSSGMRGSGSLDYSMHEVFVPARRTIRPGVTRATIDTPLAHYPNFALLAAAVSAVGLGVARRALDELIGLASAKRPQFSSRKLAESAFTQVELSRAEAKLCAARAYLVSELDRTWRRVVASDPVRLEDRAGIRSAAVHAATTGAEVSDIAYTLAGGTAVYDTSVLGRCSRDAHVVTQHVQTAPKMHETIGRVHLGIEIDASTF